MQKHIKSIIIIAAVIYALYHIGRGYIYLITQHTDAAAVGYLMGLSSAAMLAVQIKCISIADKMIGALVAEHALKDKTIISKEPTSNKILDGSLFFALKGRRPR